MNLKILSRIELDHRIKSLAAKEREILHEVLLTIKEIDGRRMYLEMGFSSLFSYLVEDVGYSEGYAQRRIDAARLLRDIPSLGERIQAGTVNLSQTTLMQKALREAKKNSQVVTAQEKTSLLEQISHKNYKQTQKEIAVFLDLPIQTTEIQTTQADDSVRVTLSLSKELYDKIAWAQELLSHSLPSKDLTVYLEHVTDKVIQQKTAVRKKSPQNAVGSKLPKANGATVEDISTFDAIVESINNTDSAAAVASEKDSSEKPPDKLKTKSVSTGIRKSIIHSQASCQFKDPITGKVCQSKWQLEVDHKQARWAGGSNNAENLQTLCRAHNIYKYKTEINVKYKSSNL